MKTIQYDRKNYPMYFKKSRNLGQLIALAEKDGEKEQLFISRIFLNDKKMDQEEEQLLSSLALSEIQSLRVEFATVIELVRHAFSHIFESIQAIQIKSIAFAKEFRRNQAIDDEKVKFILIQCRMVIESLEEIFKLHQQGHFPIKHLPLWYQAEKEMSHILQCILQARKVSRPDFLADLIEYDLVQALDQWEDSLEKEALDNVDLRQIFDLKNPIDPGDNGVDA